MQVINLVTPGRRRVSQPEVQALGPTEDGVLLGQPVHPGCGSCVGVNGNHDPPASPSVGQG